MVSDVIRLQFSPIRDLPPPGIYFTKAAFEKYSCLGHQQEDVDLPGVPALARHLPEHFQPLPQQHEDEDGSSGRASREEQPDSSSSAEAATSSDAEPDSDGADGRLEEENSLVNPQQPSEEDTGEENGDAASSEAGSSRLDEGAHAMDDMGSPHVEEYSNGGESAELPDEARDDPGITSEDLWGSDGDSEGGGGDNAAQQLHTSAARGGQETDLDEGEDNSPPKKRRRSQSEVPEKGTAKGAKADGLKQQRAGRRQRPARKAGLPAGHLEESEAPAGYSRDPADSLEQPGQPLTDEPAVARRSPAKAGKQRARTAKEPAPASGADGRGRRLTAADSAAAAAPEPLTDVAAANAEIMRAFGGLGRNRAAAALSKALAPAGRQGPAALPKPAAMRGPKSGSAANRRRGQDEEPPQAPRPGVAASNRHVPASGHGDLAADVAAESADAGRRRPASAVAVQATPRNAIAADSAHAALSVASIRRQAIATGAAEAAVGAEPADHGTAEGDAPIGCPPGVTHAAGNAAGQHPSAAEAKGAAAAAAKDGSMCDMLNPNNPLYDPAFALEYAQIRDGAGKAEGKGFKKRGPRQVWSKLSARDHAWYLENLGRALQGKEAERLADLGRRVAEEQQLFLKAMWTVPADAAATYNYMDPRANAQLQGHMAAKREAVRQLPRLWCLKRLLGLAEVTPQKTEPAMVHLSTAHTSGTPAAFTPPPGNLYINLDHPYLRQAPQQSSAEVATTQSDKADQTALPKLALHEDECAVGLAVKKRAAAVISASAFLVLARTFPPALSAGWEIPVDVVALTPDPRSGEPGSQGVGSAPRSVVCIGKPLVARELSRRAQMELLYRHALAAHGRDTVLAAPPSKGQNGSWRQSLLQQLSQEMGTELAAAADGSAAANTGAGHIIPASAADTEAMSEGGLSADLEAELAADVSDGSPLARAHAELPDQERPGMHARQSGVSAPSQVRHDLWRLGQFRIISRASVRASIPAGDNSRDPVPVTVAAKMEYHGDKAEDAEELTAEELSRWWSQAFMRPGSSLLLGHVSVRNSRLLRSESYTARSLQSSAAAAGFSPTFLWRLLQELLRALGTMRPGRYLLTHAPGSTRICIFAALPDDPDTEQADAPPLPCDTGAAGPGTVYDLWAAHANSGAADEHQVPFVPKRWRPSHADVPQVPYTFALKPPAAAGGGRGRGRGRGGRDGGRDGGGRKRQRHRKLMPSAWTVGQRPDWDEVAQPGAAAEGGKGFSTADYAQLLGEDLA